jgi:hypothetical protein
MMFSHYSNINLVRFAKYLQVMLGNAHVAQQRFNKYSVSVADPDPYVFGLSVRIL